MKLGLSTNSFFNRINTESSFDIIRQMHIDTVEVNLATFSEYEPRFLEALQAKKGNLLTHSVQPEGSQFEPQLFSTNARVRGDAEILFKKVCYATRVLGGKFYIFQGPVRLKKIEYDFDFVRLGDRVNQIAEIAKTYGIQIAYRNTFYGYGSDPKYFAELLRQCPSLQTVLCVKNAYQAGIDPIKFLDVMASRICTVHLCDVAQKGHGTALPGEGKANFEKLFIELNRRNVVTTMILDANSRDYRDINQLKQTFDNLSALWIRARSR